jgi:hypothetical protein
MIEQLPNFPDNVLAFLCKGRVTKEDYDSVLVPAVLRALEKHTPDAVWENFKVGMGHFTRWERVAVVTDVELIKQTMRFFGFLMRER